MAGFYPDVPAPRMAYDRDGTTVVVANLFGGSAGTIVGPLSGANMQIINNESSNAIALGNTDGFRLAFLFPQLRDVMGYFFGNIDGSFLVGPLVTSTDTTNGYDGTWSTVSASWTRDTSPSLVDHRQAINAITVTNVKAIGFQTLTGTANGRTLTNLHLYGAISAGETPDRLRMWHPTLDEPLDDNSSADGAYFDWGDVQRNTTSDKTFRIKNNSAALTANAIIISQQTLTDTTPTVNSQFTFSDGGAFAASIDIGNLAPGAISPVITKRFARPSNATLSLWTSRTIANPTSWS